MTPATTTSRQTFSRSLLIVALTIVAYLPALGGGFIWDDDDYVTQNDNLRTEDGLVDIWLSPRSSPQYYPMVFTTFWLEFQLWGTSAAGYHIVNVLLHGLAAALLWRVLVTLDVPGAYLAALLFALHPVHVESAAWISERKNVLSAVLYFASGLLYLHWQASARGMSDRKWGLALALFVLALLSKTVTCSLPAALLLVTWWKRGRITRQDVVPLLPFFAIGLLLAINTAHLEVSHVQASGTEWDLSPVDRVLIAGRAVWFYATKLVLPVGLSFIYPKWTINPAQALQWAFPVGGLIALIVLWQMRDRWGRGPLVAALIFAGTLLPALGFFNIYPMRYTYVADHFQYHASAALLALIAAGLHRLGRGGYVVLVPLLLLTFIRAGVFRDAEVLWRDTWERNPNSWMVNLNLARTLIARDKDEDAWPYFERQVQLAPELPETHWNYGSSLLQRRRFDEALREYDEAIRLGGAHPLPQAYFGRGMVFMDQGRWAEAAAEFQRAVELKPDYASARAWYDAAMSQLGGNRPGALPPANR